MPIINLRKFCYPIVKEDTFVEVSEEVAEALLELKREENRIISRIFYHKAYFSLDCEDGIENDAIGWEQPSPEDILIQKEDELLHEITLERLHKALSQLTPTQARRVRARYLEKKKFCEIAREERVSPGQISKSVQSGLKNICKYFEKHKWPKGDL
ncbi:MAG: sigma-70 family RNA polymerase sigma factor [Christensenellales bacterium]|jgi:DNA-directed RNA polymerase specialized sigma24 family protein